VIKPVESAVSDIITLTLNGALKVTKKPDAFAEVVIHALVPEERDELLARLLYKYHAEERRCRNVANDSKFFSQETANQTAVCP
jgi:hypothetical protein